MGRIFLLLVFLLPGALCDLPATFKVTSYDLQLTFTSNLSAPVSGNVDISLTCLSSTSTIVLHWGASLADNPAVSVTQQTTTSDPPSDVTTITSSVNRTLGQLTVTRTDVEFATKAVVHVKIDFKTRLNRDSKGLFYRQYSTNNYVIMTNPWPTFAREMFPCLDEPQLVADLQLKLTYPSSWVFGATATAGTPSTDTTSGTSTVAFNKIATPPNNFGFFLSTDMTSSLVKVTATNLVFWAKKGFSPSILSANAQFLSDYFSLVQDVVGTSLSLGQINVVMVPGLEEPFSGYGVIFIREEEYNQDYASPQMEGLFKSTVVPVVYQLIRQFTEFNSPPASWSDYWVSQALGKYIQYTILNLVMPSLDFKTDLEVARQQALYLDAQLGSKPLNDKSFSIDSTSSVQALVNDPLKGLKGAAILNMLEQSLPAGTVHNAIQNFLSKSKGGAITSSSFLTTLQKISDSPVTSSDAKQALTNTLGLWTDNSIYPLETIRIETYTNQTTIGSVSLVTTGAYCSAFNDKCNSALPSNVYVPATVRSKSDKRFYSPQQIQWPNNVVTEKTITTDIDVREGDWVVSNIKSGGYYRSNYTAENWNRIISAVASNDSRLLVRSQLIDDAFALALSIPPALNYSIAIGLSMANLGNKQYKNWVPVHRGLREIRNTLMGLSEYSSYKKFAAGYFLNLNEFLHNSSSDPFEKARIQALFLDEMCEFDVGQYRSWAAGNLTDLLKGYPQYTVASSLYDAYACCGARYDSKLTAQSLWNIIHDSSRNYYSRRFASVALGCLSNYADVSKLFDTMADADLQLKPYVQIALQNLAEKNPFAFLTNFTQRVEKFQTQLGTVSVASLIKQAGQKINSNQVSVLDGLSVDAVVSSAIVSTQGVVASRSTWLSTYNQTLLKTLQDHTLPSGNGGSLLSVVSPLVYLPLLILLSPVSC